jgi:SAM-dependent methyltransferase
MNIKPLSATDPLNDYAEVWAHKPVLRAIHQDFYDRLAAECLPGTTIEIGGGIGNLKQYLSDVIATDIQFAPWLNCVADAHRLPFAAGTAANIVMVDVLHHLEFPAAFFREATRVLQPGGRVLMVEPAMTWGSTLICRLFHDEPVRMSADSLADGTPDPRRGPYEANQAIATILATRDRARFHARFPELRMTRVHWFGFVAYPASGGFKSWSLIGADAARRVLRMERFIEPLLGRVAGFKVMIVIEKKASRGAVLSVATP